CLWTGRSRISLSLSSGRPDGGLRPDRWLNPGYKAQSGLAGRQPAHLAAAGNAGRLPTSRASCWVMAGGLRLGAIFLKRSIEASVSARSVLNVGTPLPS